MRRFAPLALVLLTALTGCGHMAPLTAGQQILSDLGVMADLPTIGAQIDKAKLGVDAAGTKVSKLPTPGGVKAVTFLTYKALDNNLSDQLPEHMNVLERAGSSTNVNAIALTDGSDKGDTREYYIRQDGDFKAITSPYHAVGRGGELDSGDAASLARAVKWGAKSYPSRFRWVDVNNHGGGYYGICQDEDTTHIIRLPQLAGALASAGKIDVLSFDACLMATAEVAFELRNAAKVLVASEDESFALGMNYDVTLAALAKQPQVDALAMSRDMVLRANRKGSDARLPTISAIDLSKAEGVKGAVDQLAVALLKALPKQKATILMSLNAVKAFYVAGPDKSDFDHRDLHEVVTQLKARVQDPGVQAACAAVQGTLFNRGGVVVMSRSANSESKITRGLSIYLPVNGNVDPVYNDTAFAKATHWDEFLAALK
ncbi:MAG: fibronectin type protein [Cyanobacteria bacterium RYN_339]|nr:fibronectin type protein [Cyanobacteria bacterium RYN_339]